MAAMSLNATKSVNDESGCHRFDILEAKEEANTYYLYEVYDDPDALEEHKATPHYKDSREALKDIVVETSVIRAEVIQQSPEEPS